ncbi:Fic family protein [Larkinella soli]|uniref:Fic family protein n=1 Tax=Larkinella soli TaxID=1770527 RepID=UPI000FFC5717|nr:Fic family protein [Larkinella soli]
MGSETSWTPSPEENLPGITDQNRINELEAQGMATAELFILQLEFETEISTGLILEIHKTAFGKLYDWAGKWRTTEVIVGQFTPPAPHLVLQLMYQFVDTLNFKLSIAENRRDHLECLFYCHYEFIRIHPFNNGNGRTGRMLMNLVALKLGYQFLK